MSLLEARDLSVSVSLDGQAVPVLRRLNLALEPGKVLGLVGESGAGKSMIGRTVAQLLPPGFSVTSGSLMFDGRDLVRMAPARRRGLLGRDIAFIPQEPLTALNPVLTIGAQMDEHFVHLGMTGRQERHARAVTALEAVHLPEAGDLLRRYPHQLSGGMCQRVLIAMAFASHPRLVVADEPTTALDVTIQAHIMELMAELQRRDGTAVLFITHDLRLAARICDDICVLYAGAVVEQGPARKVFGLPSHPYTRCLQLANPSMRGARRALYALPEQMPGLRALTGIAGCRFAPRCPVAADECRSLDPPLAGDGHKAACLRSELTASIDVGDARRPPAPHRGQKPLLEVAGLSKRFTSGSLFRRSATLAVRDVSFRIGAGEFVAVVGESGSGKSTLGRLLMGLESPSAGRIMLAGQDVTIGTEAARQHRIRMAQMVFQDPQSALNPRRRVGAIVTQALEAGGQRVSRDARERRAGELLAEMGLSPEMATRTPSQLSGGQRQRVNIARALCTVPKLLVADEIVSGLDVSVQAQMLTLLQRLRQELDFAMLFISHDLSVVRHLCDRVLVMYRGEIVEQGATEAVFAAPQHDYTRTLLAAVPAEL
ncbi:dipeptide ABC transporter ATP-binding protein [Limobrevibacterium gyesilva]|uniref:ABC transporter ATP-binding protein n=1 Tax=Limobrevibacterium gyesilva TaxID=2991712 RepID=A0AA41YL21_9PROT|nr:ABC transporter ATP-binding protein [Limobrevibacterium gyesilva]MCW3474356.1 ABC transporter ATP-binding protein [Limobrevibacterium gyesilva]